MVSPRELPPSEVTYNRETGQWVRDTLGNEVPRPHLVRTAPRSYIYAATYLYSELKRVTVEFAGQKQEYYYRSSAATYRQLIAPTGSRASIGNLRNGGVYHEGAILVPVHLPTSTVADEIRNNRRQLRHRVDPLGSPRHSHFQARLLQMRLDKYGRVAWDIGSVLPLPSLGLKAVLAQPISVYAQIDNGVVVGYKSNVLTGHPHTNSSRQCLGDLWENLRNIPLNADTVGLRRAIVEEALGVFNRSDMYNRDLEHHLTQILSFLTRKKSNNDSAAIQGLIAGWNRRGCLEFVATAIDAETGKPVPKGERLSRLLSWYVTGDWQNWKDYHPKYILEKMSPNTVIVPEEPALQVESELSDAV